MNHTGIERSKTCFLCGGSDLITMNYLRLNSDSFKRNLAYALPNFIAHLFSITSNRFSAAYHPVSVNKKYFDRLAVYCPDCCTGSCQPFFNKEDLSNYYKEFYWFNRNIIDGQHVTHNEHPNNRQLSLTRDRIDWIHKYLHNFGSVIDFGAGDCAAGFTFSKNNVSAVHIVDPSVHTRGLAKKYNLSYFEDLAKAPVVDLIYSAHSIEHVYNLRLVMNEILEKVHPKGYVFFETPNIADIELFRKLPHTPHTFMLSQRSFEFMESIFPVKIIAIESCGPPWVKNSKHIRSGEKADLRVLMQKIGDS